MTQHEELDYINHYTAVYICNTMTTVQVDPESYARSDALAPSFASSQIDENVSDFGNIDDVIIQMDAVDTNNCFTVSTMFDFDKKLIEPLSFDEIVQG